MKKLLLLSTAVGLCLTLNAQQNRVKFSDIVQQHEQAAKATGNQRQSIYENPEKEEYQFNRWEWYWSQHTDQDGYIVSRHDAAKVWSAYKGNRALSKGTADQSNWKLLGPLVNSGTWLGFSQSGIGRINTMTFHPTTTELFAVGTAGGGLWYTDDFGKTWENITDDLMSPAVSDFDFNPMNPNTMYMCTGDKNAVVMFSGKGADYNSMGLLKSIDAGQTWDTTGLVQSVSDYLRTNGLVINPQDTNSLTLVTNTSIMKSFDGGDSWTNVTPAVPAGEAIVYMPEVVYNAADTSILYIPATMVDSNNGYRKVSFLVSADGGSSWQSIGAVPYAVRGAIAVTPADADVVTVIIANDDFGLQGIYRSTDKGNSYNLAFSDNNCTTNLLASAASGQGCGGQGFYDLCIAVDPTDEDHIVVGGVNSWESKDGGQSWNLLTQWATEEPNIALVHADHHYLGFHPLMPQILFDCNDGGVSYYGPSQLTGSVGWHDIAGGMNISQYYRNAVNEDASFVLAGAQDNGTMMVATATGISKEVGPGDGMDCHIDPTDPNIIYVGSQNGSFMRIDVSKGLSFGNLVSISGNIASSPKGAWTAPMLINPHDSKQILAGYDSIYLSTDRGDSWTAISPAYNDKIYRLVMSEHDMGTIYASEQTGADIHMTNNMGGTWTTFSHPYNEPKISDLQVDQNDKDRIWITFPGYGAGKTKVATYYQGTWVAMDENLPDLPVYCLVQDKTNGVLYIGTYTGVYYRTTDMTQWEPYATELPTVSVMDLGINYKTGQLIAATWGRGMYQTPKYEKPLSINNTVPYAIDVVNVHPNPSAGGFLVTDNGDYFTNKHVTASMIDVTGKTVWQTQAIFAGDILDIDANVPTGSYVLNITGDDGKTAKARLTIIKQ